MFVSLRSRLIAIFVVLLTVPLVIFALILNREASRMVGTSTSQSAEQALIQYAAYAEAITTQLENAANQVLSNDVTQEWAGIDTQDADREDGLLLNGRMKRYLSSIALNHSAIHSIAVYKDSGIALSGDQVYRDGTFTGDSWYTGYKRGKRWAAAHQDRYLPRAVRTEPVNSLVFPLVNLQTLTEVGVIKINVKTALLQEPLERIRIGETGRAFLIDGDRREVLEETGDPMLAALAAGVARRPADMAGNGVRRLELADAGQPSLVGFYQPLRQSDWIVAAAVAEKDLLRSLTKLQIYIALVVFVLLAVSVAIATWIASGIARPLSRLASAMKYVESGDFGTAETVLPRGTKVKGEIGYVTSVFDRMQSRIKHLIQTEYQANLHRRDAEYKALLMQINPHFLYNTLEVIGSLAAQGATDEVIDVTESLGSMLRFSLKLDSERVSLREELRQAGHYAGIVRARFGDRIAVEIEAEPDVMDASVVKFILQPLLENAVKYTMEYKDAGRVAVTANRTGSLLCIRVADNGIGMPAARLSELLEEEGGAGGDAFNMTGKRIGLRNVLARCRLRYGESFRAEIDSGEGAGTTVALYMPLTEEEDRCIPS